MGKTEVWFTRDYGREGKALSMSKSVLGLFMFHLLKIGGKLDSIHAMNAKYDRSYVQAVITLPEGKKEELEQLTGITLEKPVYLAPPINRMRYGD